MLLNLVFLSGIAIATGQSQELKTLRSQARSVVIDLASFNHFKLKNSAQQDYFAINYSNHISFQEPTIAEKNGSVHVAVVIAKDYLPGSQQHKYRAGQPEYPDYTIELPKNVEVKIVYEKGNFEMNKFLGNVALFVNHGAIDIIDPNGSVFVQSYAGTINCWLHSAAITIENTNGSISSKLQDEKLKSGKGFLKGIYKEPKHELEIRTIAAKVQLQPLIDE